MTLIGRNELEKDYPLGIRYWVQVDKTKVPHIEVFECMGTLYSPDYWAFMSLRDEHLMSKTFEELLDNTEFKPFLLNLEKLRKRYGAL